MVVRNFSLNYLLFYWLALLVLVGWLVGCLSVLLLRPSNRKKNVPVISCKKTRVGYKCVLREAGGRKRGWCATRCRTFFSPRFSWWPILAQTRFSVCTTAGRRRKYPLATPKTRVRIRGRASSTARCSAAPSPMLAMHFSLDRTDFGHRVYVETPQQSGLLWRPSFLAVLEDLEMLVAR